MAAPLRGFALFVSAPAASSSVVLAAVSALEDAALRGARVFGATFAATSGGAEGLLRCNSEFAVGGTMVTGSTVG